MYKKPFHIIILLGIVLALHICNAQASDVTLKEINGDVEILIPDAHKWVAAKDGSVVPEGTQIRTGPFSNASLEFPNSSVALVDSFTHFTIEKFSKSEDLVTTRLLLHIGSIVSTLNKNTTLDNDYEIITPTATFSLDVNEIKKVVAGAMYSDSVRATYKAD